MNPSTMKVSDYICRFLLENKAHHIFAISGAGNVHIFDSIAACKGLEYVCTHHEQAGVMASIVYARLSSNLGVSLTTGGPGAVNALSGVLDAWADSMPILVISGQEKSIYTNPENPLRMWGVQGFDVVQAVSGFTKYAATVRDASTIRYHLERALHECFHGRPGPVWLDIPMDVQASVISVEEMEGYTPSPTHLPLGKEVGQVLDLLSRSERPVILLGHGLRLAGAAEKIPDLVKRFPAAFLTSWAGADLLSSTHPKNFGHAGVYGQRCANFVLQNCDFFLSIGSRLAIPQVGYDMDEFARAAKKVMVDIDPTELGKHETHFDMCIRADAHDFVEALLTESENTHFPDTSRWLARCQKWKKSYPLLDPSIHENETGFINSYHFVDKLSSSLAPDDVIVTDMGTALTCTHQAIRLQEGQRLVTSTGLGEMGFGLPGAVGAAFARPGQRIIFLVGDGSFMMNLQELQTAVHHKLPIKIFLYDNDAYLTIKHTQAAIFKGRLAGSDSKTGVSCPDFQKISEAFGIRAIGVSDINALDAAISETLEGDDTAMCVIRMHPIQLLAPKVSFSIKPDGSMISPPLEDLSPFLPRETLRSEMIIGVHPKSEKL